MANENNPPPQPQPEPAPKPPVERAEQDQEIANNITEAEQVINTAKTDPEIAPLVAARGYDAETLAEGAALRAAAQSAFNQRQQALGDQRDASNAMDQAEKASRELYADFRETARALYGAGADQTKLGLKGNVPADLQKFITTARASYTAGQAEPYAAKLAKHGFKPETLAAALKGLDQLKDANETHRKASGDAIKATKTRDRAHDDLMAWMGRFKRIAKVALRRKPELRSKLKL